LLQAGLPGRALLPGLRGLPRPGGPGQDRGAAAPRTRGRDVVRGVPACSRTVHRRDRRPSPRGEILQRMISDPQLPQAVLIDMDGTLVDTEPMWVATEAEVAASFGHTWTAEDQRYCLGASATTVAAYIAERTGTRTPQGEIIDMMYAAVARRMAEGPALRPGAKELLAEL